MSSRASRSPSWGGGISVANLWLRTSDTSNYGVAFSVQPDGCVRVSGTASDRAQTISALTVAALANGRTYSVSGSAGGVRTWVKFFAGGSTLAEHYGDATFTVPDGADTMFCGLVVDSGNTVDATVRPMLCEGLPAGYVPYDLGGGQVLENLWRWGKPTDVFKLLDDGGVQVDYEGGQDVNKWTNIMWKGTIEDAGIEVGATYYLAEFGEGDERTVSIRLLDSNMSQIPSASYKFERPFTVPDNAAYVDMYVTLDGTGEPASFRAYPMLVRGSERPAGFVPPNGSGGGYPRAGTR